MKNNFEEKMSDKKSKENLSNSEEVKVNLEDKMVGIARRTEEFGKDEINFSEIREIKESKKSISEWLGEENQSLGNIEDLEIETSPNDQEFRTTRKDRKEVEGQKVQSSRHERQRSREIFDAEYSNFFDDDLGSEPAGRQIDFNRIKERMKEEGLFSEMVEKKSQYPLLRSGENFMMGLDHSNVLDLEGKLYTYSFQILSPAKLKR